MNELITIDPKEIQVYADDGGSLVFKKEAEISLQKLLEVQKYINDKVDEVKDKIAEAGQSIDSDFKGVVGENVKATYRYFGTKYDYDRDVKGDALPYLKEITYHKPDIDAIEKYLEEVGELPPGIMEKTRNKQLVISIKDE